MVVGSEMPSFTRTSMRTWSWHWPPSRPTLQVTVPPLSLHWADAPTKRRVGGHGVRDDHGLGVAGPGVRHQNLVQQDFPGNDRVGQVRFGDGQIRRLGHRGAEMLSMLFEASGSRWSPLTWALLTKLLTCEVAVHIQHDFNRRRRGCVDRAHIARPAQGTVLARGVRVDRRSCSTTVVPAGIRSSTRTLVAAWGPALVMSKE